VLVGLVQRTEENAAGGPSLAAYPLGKGSGSVTTFSRAEGFITIGRHEEIIAAETIVDVQLLARDLRLADLVVIGSHCVGLDYLLAQLEGEGIRTKFLAVGSLGGLDAARRGECDVAGIHLLDPATGQYNEPFLQQGLELVRGYGRMQGIVFRPDNARFAAESREAIHQKIRDGNAGRMVNRNTGSGTRVLIDHMLAGAQPPGYAVQPRSHNAVAAAIAQGRADWGVCIETVARQTGLDFVPLQQEQYDFVVPTARLHRPAVERFLAVLRSSAARAYLASLHFQVEE
jgi:putative molybdopterin biosynthesis protein